MEKSRLGPIFSLMLVLAFLSFVTAESYPAPFTIGGNSQNSNSGPRINCPEGYSITSYTEESPTSPSGYSTTYDCKKNGNGIIELAQGNDQPPNVEDGVLFIPRDSEEPEREKSQEEIDCLRKGCFMDNICYPFGSIKNGTACSQKGKLIGTYAYPAFVNQSETGLTCNQGYECKSGVCSNGFCIDLDNVTAEISSLKNDLSALSQQNTELNSSLLETQQSVEESNNLLQKIANFLKDWFGFS